MNHITLLIVSCLTALPMGCKGSDHGSHEGEAHQEHAGHDDHPDDEHAHAEHGGKGEAHDDHEHGDEAHEAHAGHDDHEGDDHDHAEHGAAGEGHDDHGHGDEAQDEHAGHDDHEGDEHDHAEHGGDAGHDDHDEDGEEKVVQISAEALSRSGIRLGTATSGTLAGAVEIPAEVQLNPDRVAHVSPLVSGQLLSVDVTLGDTVAADAQLAQLRSVELGQARAEFDRTSALRRVARTNRTRQRKLRKEGISSERSLLEAELAYEQADAERDAAHSRLMVFGLEGGNGPDMALQSPIAGLVVERHATRGENVSPDDTLFVVADLSRVWVIGRVYEQQVAQVRPDMAATLTLNAYPSRSWTGTVDFVGATLDETTRTLPIRVEIDNADGVLRPGLFGTLRLASGQPTGTSVIVPLTAVQTLENRPVVFVPGPKEGSFAAHPVTIGRESAQQAEVLAGLTPGDRIVVDGAFILKSELMRGQLGHGHAH